MKVLPDIGKQYIPARRGRVCPDLVRFWAAPCNCGAHGEAL